MAKAEAGAQQASPSEATSRLNCVGQGGQLLDSSQQEACGVREKP